MQITHFRVHFVDDKTLLLHLIEGGKFTTEVHILTPTTPSWTLRHVATFEYPSVKPSYVAQTTYQACTCTWNRPHGVFSRHAPPSPFVPARDADLLMICSYFDDDQILYCVPSSVFKAAGERRLGSLHSSAQATVVPWKSWGPETTRCFWKPESPTYSFVPRDLGHQTISWGTTLLDFNQLDIARDLQGIGKHVQNAHCTKDNTVDHPSQKPYKRVRYLWPFRFGGSKKRRSSCHENLEDICYDNVNTRIIRRPTVIPRGEVFSADVITKLPYRQIELQWDQKNSFPWTIFGGETWVAMTRDGNPVSQVSTCFNVW